MTRLVPPPSWLAPLQGAFGAVLTTPLDPSTGTLRSRRDRYPPDLLTQLADHPRTADRLALYHEQYWMRLLTAMQGELPRFARAVGYWQFNGLAALHLQDRPPVRVDLARCADGFAARLLATLHEFRGRRSPRTPDLAPVAPLVTADTTDPWLLVWSRVLAPMDLARQALHTDEATRHALSSPYEGIWRPTPDELGKLDGARLRYAASVRVLREDWALADHAAASAGTDEPFQRRDLARFHVSFRTAHTTALRRIEPMFARFLTAAAQQPFGKALATVEIAAGIEHSTTLRSALPGWIRLALESGWWVGLRADGD